MAVSGAGGWKPSSLVILRNDQLEKVGITQNAPPSSIVDLEVALSFLLDGKTVRINAMQFVQLKEMIEETG